MKLLKSLLLAAPATIIAAYAAQAADLPSRKAAPIEYVRICDAYGAGFFYIPGTDTCLHVGGYMRFEWDYQPGQDILSPNLGAPANNYVSQIAGDQDTTGMEIRGRVDLDARTQTEWGTAQTVIWLRGTGTEGLKALNPVGSTYTAITTGAYTPTGAPAGISLERAFVRFAGLTAGIATDNFTTMPPFMYTGFTAGFPVGVKELAYTATFGGGFSSTLAIEARSDFGNSGSAALYSYNSQPQTGYNLVGNVRYDAAWGFVQLSGALGNNSYAPVNVKNTVPDSVLLLNQEANNNLLSPSTQGAWAIGLSGAFKLPMISPGDQFHWSTAYGHGMFGLIGCTQGVSDCNDPTNRRWLGGLLRYDTNLIPISAVAGVTVNGVTGTQVTFGTTDSWSIAGLYTHYWSPTWRTNIVGQYQRITEPTVDALSAVNVGEQLGDANVYGAGANLIWEPTKGFNIGVEIDYMHMDQVLQNVQAGSNTALFLAQTNTPGTAGYEHPLSNGGWMGRLRIERAF